MRKRNLFEIIGTLWYFPLGIFVALFIGLIMSKIAFDWGSFVFAHVLALSDNAAGLTSGQAVAVGSTAAAAGTTGYRTATGGYRMRTRHGWEYLSPIAPPPDFKHIKDTLKDMQYYADKGIYADETDEMTDAQIDRMFPKPK